MSKLICSSAIDGAVEWVARADAGVARAIKAHGDEHAVGFPSTAYYLPVIYSLSGDKVETLAIKKAFGNYAYNIPISSTKSMMGHLIGGAGAVEAAITIMVIQHGVVPPTINLTHPDPECDLDYVPNVARKAEINVCLKNSFGLGGQNCCLVFKRFKEI